MKPEPAPRTGGWLPRGPCWSGPGMPKRRKKSKKGSLGERPGTPLLDCCGFSTTSTFTTAGPYFSTSGEKSGSARNTPSTLGVATGVDATAGGGASAICGRAGDWALSPPEHATNTMETHNTETARWAGRETLMLDSGLRGLAGPRDEGLGFIRAPIKFQHLACPQGAAGRKTYASKARTPAPLLPAAQSANFQHGRRE